MQNLILFLVNILVGISISNAAIQNSKYQTYNMSDLAVLESDNDFLEFFKHAKDVRPSKRDKTWKKLVLSMAINYVSYLQKDTSDFSDKDYNLVLKISSWSPLNNDEFFIKKRDLAFIKYYTKCFKINDFNKCHTLALNFFQKYKTHDEFGFTFLKEVSKNKFKEQTTIDLLLEAKQSFWPFLTDFVKKPISEFYCAQEPLKQAIEQKIIKQTYLDPKFKILNHFHPDCWKVIKQQLVKTLYGHTNAYTRKKVYDVIKSNLRMSKADVYTFTVLQLLSGIKLDPDEVMEYWGRLEKLSQDYDLRMKIHERLKNILPLPGNVFMATTKQQKLILKSFAKNFPEYLDFYSTTCLEHLSGEKESHLGNPAFKCHELFKASKKIDLIPKSKILRYNKITTF